MRCAQLRHIDTRVQKRSIAPPAHTYRLPWAQIQLGPEKHIPKELGQRFLIESGGCFF
jgi:hypothetical protein